MSETVLQVSGLKKYFPHREGFFSRQGKSWIKAVDRVSFGIEKGRTFGLVGESGCGKSTTGKVILRVLDPTDGEVRFLGEDIAAISGKSLKNFRRRIQAVYQDPYASLNPRMRVDHIVSQPLLTHVLYKGGRREERALELLKKVGISREQARRYPHEFSGGQRQRIGIARALAPDPDFIVLDEPVSALDVSIQAQILNLLADLQEEMGLTYLFISHDLSVVEHICDQVAVMYLGRIVESAPTGELFRNPRHPYTKSLLSAVPVADPEYELKAIPLVGEIPSPLNPPKGCSFHPRCPECMPECREQEPFGVSVSSGHLVHCHLC
ncbi:ABC transporter ATP-binding protein [Dethiosulfatarculus sandiegensis]|uniref:Peptide ABC transporter substrate-binding protein n=1 Tax=Dethiosulfatarculus sandiegensis TaxID=1429043 RepID=A0A0D2K1K4_9BACT|nr:oligopeptide/dipeptide ABC transporter ATP-binding protein [Dethiosulfatarculus sandiegensis]KIX15540.1 peptide ABC transporter substrate-binding protein [Dethiosulfatarculus sandiegensis]